MKPDESCLRWVQDHLIGLPEGGMIGLPEGSMAGLPEGGMIGLPEGGMTGLPEGGMIFHSKQLKFWLDKERKLSVL